MKGLTVTAVVLVILGILGYLYFGREKLANTEPVPDAWLSGQGEGASFKYPADFGTKYLQAFDWPPQVRVLDEPYSCTAAGSETEKAGRTEERIIGGKKFCITTLNEGAAGSTYAQYAYLTPSSGKTVAMTFTVRYPQCGNYPEPEKSACDTERQAFNLDDLMKKVADTVRFTI